MAVENYLGAMGQLADPNAAFQQGFANQQAIQGQSQQQQIQRIALQQAQAKAQQEQAQQRAWATDIASFTQNPTAEGAANLALKHPEQHEAIKQSFEMRDKSVQDADRQGLALVYSSLDNGRPELALKYLTDRQAADKAAGKPEPMVDTLLQSLQSDPTGKSAKGISAYILSAIPGGDDFAKTLAAVGGGKDKTHVITLGGALVDDTGKELYRANDTAKYEKVKNADGTESIVALPSTAGAGVSSPSGQYTGGWTPRARHGGDNSDAAVDGKIAGAAQFLGVDPTAPLTGISPLKIAQAMALSEGGKGTLADRNNNPGNIRGPGGEGGYRKYPTKEAGLAAAASLVARKLKNGQTTVQTLIEGLPKGGQVGTPVYTSQGAVDTGNDLRGEPFLATLPTSRQATIKAIAEGRTAAPKPGTRFGQALLEQVAQYDPSFDAANAQSRQKTRVDFTSGKSAAAVNALNTAMGHLIHLDDQAHDLGNSSFAPGIINPIYNASRQAMGDTKLPAFQQTKQAAASEMRKVFAGSSGGNLTELEAWEKSLNESQSYPQLHAAIKNGVQLMGSRLDALKDQYGTGMQRSDQVPTFLKPSLARKAAQQFGVDLRQNVDTPVERQAPIAPPAGATKALRDPKTGKVAYLVGGKWVVK